MMIVIIIVVVIIIIIVMIDLPDRSSSSRSVQRGDDTLNDFTVVSGRRAVVRFNVVVYSVT